MHHHEPRRNSTGISDPEARLNDGLLLEVEPLDTQLEFVREIFHTSSSLPSRRRRKGHTTSIIGFFPVGSTVLSVHTCRFAQGRRLPAQE
jgi:hypothetical protein